MHYLSIDHIVVYVFLLVTLVVGLLAGRAIKDIEEYAIANRVYGTGVLTITFLATFIGGSTIIGTTGNVFRDGILPIIATGVAPMICILWMAVWIAPRIIHFEGSLTMGDIMGTLYGRHGQVATGVLGFLFTICAVSAQIVALAYVYEFLLGFKSYWAIGLGGLIAVTYASMGGMKAVTTTQPINTRGPTTRPLLAETRPPMNKPIAAPMPKNGASMTYRNRLKSPLKSLASVSWNSKTGISVMRGNQDKKSAVAKVLQLHQSNVSPCYFAAVFGSAELRCRMCNITGNVVIPSTLDFK